MTEFWCMRSQAVIPVEQVHLALGIRLCAGRVSQSGLPAIVWSIEGRVRILRCKGERVHRVPDLLFPVGRGNGHGGAPHLFGNCGLSRRDAKGPIPIRDTKGFGCLHPLDLVRSILPCNLQRRSVQRLLSDYVG